MVLVVPMAVTIYITFLLFDFADNILGNLVASTFGTRIFGLGLLATVILFIFVGMVAQNWITRSLLHYLDTLLESLPVARSIYQGAKQINDILFKQQQAVSFNRVVLVEFPKENSWSIGFLTGTFPSHLCSEFAGRTMCNVFVPTTPNPTSGYLLIVNQEKVIDTAMTYEEAMKMIISGGLIQPQPPGSLPPAAESGEDFTIPH